MKLQSTAAVGRGPPSTLWLEGDSVLAASLSEENSPHTSHLSPRLHLGAGITPGQAPGREDTTVTDIWSLCSWCEEGGGLAAGEC